MQNAAGSSGSARKTSPQPAPRDAAAAVQLHQAVLAAEHGNLAGALAEAGELTARFPAYAPGIKFKGAMLEATGHPQEAEASYEQALRLAPADTELLYSVGLYQLISGDRNRAVDLFTRRLKLAPRDAETLFYLAQAYHLQGNNELALRTIEKSAKLAPDNPAILQKQGELLSSSGDHVAALASLLKAQQLDPRLTRIDLDLAVASYRNQDLDNATKYASAAVQLRPDDPEGLILLAETEVKLAQWEEAEPVYRHLLTLRPDDPAALLGLGHCQLSLKQYQPAVDTLERLLQQDSTTILAHFYLARAYAGLGRKSEAEHEAALHGKLVEQAASVVPRDEREIEKAVLIQARQLLAQNKEADAVALFRAHSKGPTATEGAPYMLTGVVYLYMGRSEDAERSLRKAVFVEPKVREAHTYLGLIALQQRDFARAEADFQQELAQNPDSQLAVAELGEVRYRQGQWEAAADQLARSRTVSPALLFMLSDSYFHLGRINDANLTAELAVSYAHGDRESIERVLDLLNRNGQTDVASRLASR